SDYRLTIRDRVPAVRRGGVCLHLRLISWPFWTVLVAPAHGRFLYSTTKGSRARGVGIPRADLPASLLSPNRDSLSSFSFSLFLNRLTFSDSCRASGTPCDRPRTALWINRADSAFPLT